MHACCFSGSISLVFAVLYPIINKAGINNIINGDTVVDDFFMLLMFDNQINFKFFGP